MATELKFSLSELTSEAQFAALFDAKRSQMLAVLRRRISSKLAARVDPEGIIQDAFVRALPRWMGLSEKPADVDAWIWGQLMSRYSEVIRAALGATRDVARECAWPDESVAELKHKLFDSDNRPSAALSHEEHCLALGAALQKLESVDREILALRYFDNLNFAAIAVIVGLSENTTNQRAVRALLKLKKLIPRSLRPPGQSST